MLSPELQTLDQLECSDLPVEVIRGLDESEDHFLRAVVAMLRGGQIRVRTHGGDELPEWEWNTLLSEPRLRKGHRFFIADLAQNKSLD